MKKKKCAGIMALVPLALMNYTLMPVSAEVTDYQEADTSMEETSAQCQVIYKSTYDFSEEIPKYPELDISVSGYEGIYDGKSHGITVGCKTEGVTILYSTDGKTYTDKKPVFTDAGAYVTYYKAEKDGYITSIGSETVRIKEAAIEFDADDCNTFYDGKNHSIDVSAKTDGCKILYSEDGINFTSKKPKYKEPGTYVVYYKIMRDNYATVTGSSTVAIKAKDGAVNSNNQYNSSQNNRSQNNGRQIQNDNKMDGNGEDVISRVQTGDGSHILLYSAMFLASVFGLAKNRGRKEKRKL